MRDTLTTHLYHSFIQNKAVPLHDINPLNAELNPICYLMTLLGAHHFFHVSRIRVKSLILRLLMSYIYIYIYMCVCVYIYMYIYMTLVA